MEEFDKRDTYIRSKLFIAVNLSWRLIEALLRDSDISPDIRNVNAVTDVTNVSPQ